ncbi:undecaprenyl-phosphate glucose phosphotransferase [Candidatus Wirthbacteria bacterium CG2_30_54_11]|uniref:Undecaprenyl-phosphate glucose phosphotransferase n=1 Tax=Candidatus Wirthbacteria bacterium CG2_30_54_11 TaxID=1817892 RepID=A0A1J5IXW0_9BACT|nr:MAG: undecaprenyl-phosphate glucose phosphotransferase [Candidatus Wirthbacteria bacterium CG2_30_54_11]
MKARTLNRIFTCLFILTDFVAIFLSFVTAYVIRRQADVATSLDLIEVPVLDFAFRDFIRIAPWISLAWLLLFVLTGQYSRIEKRTATQEMYRIFQGTSLGLLSLMVFAFFQGRNLFSRLIIVYAWSISLFALGTGRLLLHFCLNFLWSRGIGTRRTLFCSLGKIGRPFLEGIRQRGWSGHQMIGVLEKEFHEVPTEEPDLLPEPTPKGPIIEPDPGLIAGFPYRGSIQELTAILVNERVDEVIIGLGTLSDPETTEIFSICQLHHVRVSFIPDVMSLTSRLSVSETLNGIPLLSQKRYPLQGFSAIVKRLFDISLSGVGLIVLSPFMALVALLVKTGSPGPVLYGQERTGLFGRTFRILKFRSMHHQSAEKQGVHWTVANDKRRTGIGRLIRRTNLDELPQLWNILKGDMSLVGPRPEQPQFVQQLKKDLPLYNERHAIRPGLTGWAQVNGWRGNTSIAERLQYDLFYIENWSLGFDLKIMLLTFRSFFFARGAY